MRPALGAAPASPAPCLPLAMRLLVPYLRREWPMWGRLYRWIGGADPARWRTAGRATVRGKLHGYEMELDLANWSERLSYCLARYHDLPLQLLLQRVLRPGDAFVDVGANLGLVTLLASRLCGPTGCVVACEPNPALGERLAANVRRNDLANVRLVREALGDARGTARLHLYGGHPGWGSLTTVGPEGAAATAVYDVPVALGDDVLRAVPAHHPLVIKIDVEGFEVPVLRGLRGTLAARQPLVILEVADAHQRRAGFSAAQLRAEIERIGYRGYAIETRRSLLRHRLRLLPIDQSRRTEVDGLFVPRHGPLAERVGGLLAGRASP